MANTLYADFTVRSEKRNDKRAVGCQSHFHVHLNDVRMSLVAVTAATDNVKENFKRKNKSKVGGSNVGGTSPN